MKTILHSISLFSVAALVTLVGAETLGFTIPSATAYAVCFAGFIISLLLLTFRDDYVRNRLRFEPRPNKIRLLPASDAFAVAGEMRHVRSSSWTARHHRIRRSIAQR